MPTRGRSAPSHDKQDVLDRNAGVDRTVVAAYRQLERELRQLGVEVRPRYGLEPPLGGGRPGDRNLTAGQPGDIRLQKGRTRA